MIKRKRNDDISKVERTAIGDNEGVLQAKKVKGEVGWQWKPSFINVSISHLAVGDGNIDE